MSQGPKEDDSPRFLSATSRDLEVLQYFLWKPENHCAYAAQIAQDTKRISKVWAKKVCDKFVERRVLGYKLRRPPRRKEKTRHFFLREDTHSFKGITEIFLTEAHPLYGRAFLRSQFCSRMLANDLIRQVLFEKGVEIRRRVKRDSNASLAAKDGTHRDSRFTRSNHWSLRLPVLPGYVLPDSRLEKVEAANRDYVSDLPSHRELSGIVAQHYANWEVTNILLPILCLCQVSPSALEYFLFGEWSAFREDNRVNYSEQGTSMIDHLLFRMIFRAMADISDDRRCEAGIVHSAVVRPQYGEEPSDFALLALNLTGGDSILYDCGFDTEPLYYGDETGDICEAPPINPENCWVRVKYRKLAKQLDANAL